MSALGGDDNNNKWSRTPLKSSWYDDHFGHDATAREIVENRLRLYAARALPNDEEVSSSDGELSFERRT